MLKRWIVNWLLSPVIFIARDRGWDKTSNDCEAVSDRRCLAYNRDFGLAKGVDGKRMRQIAVTRVIQWGVESVLR